MQVEAGLYMHRRRKQGEPKGEAPFALGSQSGRVAPLLAHDFPQESLVCYTFASG